MNDADLNKKLDQMMETLLGNFDNVHGELKELRKDMQNAKLEMLDCMTDLEGRLVDRLANKETVRDHEQRLQHLETHLN